MENTHSIMDIFGTNVFNDKAMRQYLPKSIYYELRKTIEGRKDLDPAIADVVAAAIKKWAIEKGATHYTQRSDKGRTGRFLLPVRRTSCNL